MKKNLCILCALCLMLFSAQAEINLDPIPDQTQASVSPTASAKPTASAEPTGVVYSCELFSLTLPAGFAALDETALAAYAAGVEADYPDSGDIWMAAQNADGTAAVSIAASVETIGAEAAATAASTALGIKAAPEKLRYGTMDVFRIRCALDDTDYALYYLQQDQRLFIVTSCALDDIQTDALLASIHFEA